MSKIHAKLSAAHASPAGSSFLRWEASGAGPPLGGHHGHHDGPAARTAAFAEEEAAKPGAEPPGAAVGWRRHHGCERFPRFDASPLRMPRSQELMLG